MKWLNPKVPPFQIYGLPYFDTEQLYRRLQSTPPHPLPQCVEMFSDWPAGGQVRFRGKFRELQIRVTLDKSYYMPFMPPSGHSGFDCYVMRPGIDREFRYFSTAQPVENNREYTSTLIALDTPVDCEVLLNMPLYANLESFSLGFNDDAEITAGHPLSPGRIVVYGSSIEQGACASRPGMAYTNILSRWMNMEFINLGFNGSGKAEEEVALAIREIDDITMFIINTAGNCPDDVWLAEKMPRFLEILREKYPTVPILIWQLADFVDLSWQPEQKRVFYNKLQVEEDVYHQRKEAGDTNIHIARMDYLETFMGHEIYEEVTSDRCHPTDLGFMMTAKKLYPLLLDILTSGK